jgi:hypothetical protein
MSKKIKRMPAGHEFSLTLAALVSAAYEHGLSREVIKGEMTRIGSLSREELKVELKRIIALVED